MDEIRFYVDEHIANAIVEGLRREGIDVLTPVEVGRVGFPDEEQLAFARIEERVFVTFDNDFLALNASGIPHAGIAFCKAGKLSIGEMIEALKLIHDLMEPAEMTNHVEYL